VNAWSAPLDFKVPAAPSGRPWRRAVDTALPSPDDITEEDQGPRIAVRQLYRVQGHSLIILVSDQ
jgi:isoamylase